ncbi:hypothetical protein F9K85_13215 [Brucella tritici]|nr:hypothetical protein F9K85_13215 [Brucella tritici]
MGLGSCSCARLDGRLLRMGAGMIGRSLALAAFALAIATTIAAFLFWNLLLPFYGLLYLWGAH